MEFNFTGDQYAAMVLAQRVFDMLAVAFALWRGDRIVRLVALVFLAQAAGPPVIEHFSPEILPTKAYLLVDVPAVAILGLLTVRAPRPGVLGVCAFKLLVVATHLGRLIDPSIGLLAYATAANAWVIFADFALLFAAVQAARSGAAGATA